MREVVVYWHRFNAEQGMLFKHSSPTSVSMTITIPDGAVLEDAHIVWNGRRKKIATAVKQWCLQLR